jgi:hypothetical protein
MARCIACRSAALTAPARPAGPSSCRCASSWQRLADLVLVGVAADPVAVRRAERVGHRGHQPAGAAVLDDLAELVEHQVAVRGGIQDAVGSPLGADGVDDGGEVAGAEAGRVGPAGGGQRVGGRLAGA